MTEVNIWQKLARNKKPFFCLAPMAGVTDFAFREILAEIGGPDLFFTEFVSTEMVARNFFEVGSSDPTPTKKFRKDLPPILNFSEKQHPIIAQFFGCKPEQFRICASLAVKLGFDGIDINLGCPDRKVLKQGAGSELIKNPKLVEKIIRATIEGCGGKIPVSIKTRLGYDKKNIQEYLEILKNIAAEGNISAITIHGRTVKQGYSGKADWGEIGKFAKELKKAYIGQTYGNYRRSDLCVIGNGDIKSIEQGKKLAEKYGLDGVMIGRQILRNPWVFNKSESLQIKDRMNPNINERVRVALKHTKLFEKFYRVGSGNPTLTSNIGAMKKYYKAYLSGIPADLVSKKELMECKSVGEAKRLLMSNIQFPMSNQCQNPNNKKI